MWFIIGLILGGTLVSIPNLRVCKDKSLHGLYDPAPKQYKRSSSFEHGTKPRTWG